MPPKVAAAAPDVLAREGPVDVAWAVQANIEYAKVMGEKIHGALVDGDIFLD